MCRGDGSGLWFESCCGKYDCQLARLGPNSHKFETTKLGLPIFLIQFPLLIANAIVYGVVSRGAREQCTAVSGFVLGVIITLAVGVLLQALIGWFEYRSFKTHSEYDPDRQQSVNIGCGMLGCLGVVMFIGCWIMFGVLFRYGSATPSSLADESSCEDMTGGLYRIAVADFCIIVIVCLLSCCLVGGRATTGCWGMFICMIPVCDPLFEWCFPSPPAPAAPLPQQPSSESTSSRLPLSNDNFSPFQHPHPSPHVFAGVFVPHPSNVLPSAPLLPPPRNSGGGSVRIHLPDPSAPHHIPGGVMSTVQRDPHSPYAVTVLPDPLAVASMPSAPLAADTGN